MNVIKADATQFAEIRDFPFQPNFIEYDGVSIHYVDEGPENPKGTFLLGHGEPSWSYLYRDWIGPLNEAGYRCIAVDLPGFGKSDKPTSRDWYTYERHCGALRAVIDALDLRDIHLVVQDWGGAIGLRQAVDQPERFARLFIFNTTVWHEGVTYSPRLWEWMKKCDDPESFGHDMPVGQIVFAAMKRGGHDPALVSSAFDAPFTTPESKAGAQAFPYLIPFGLRENAETGSDHNRIFETLKLWQSCPVHLIFGDADEVYPWEWAETWAAMIPHATLDRIDGGGHFVQFDAADDCVAAILSHLK
ncbi:alpha/beta fold hydrolase [uncultured Erythrobacter sp.]|uniref:alpha/beta fold hydrolase n=1 Tax=uncultured Erythrobacter sp. TaxID=263913 RepID=UPI002605915F|nr:alpha/beta fold hydrolase [uncultured Erythrobacter sp.]